VRIAVIGGGNGAHAAAADLSEAGHEVAFWRRDAAAMAPLLADPRIAVRDHAGARRVPIARPTTDLAAALDGAELIVAPLPATAQSTLARALAPHLVAGQVVLLPPGSFGSVLMPRWLRAAGGATGIAFAESGTLPWLTRRHGDGVSVISGRAVRLPTGVFPTADTARAFAILECAFPAIERLVDGLDGALMNAGPIIHPPLILMNAGPLQHFERWDIHAEGTQPAIRAVTTALDQERIALREALGYGPPHFPLRDHYERDQGEPWMYGRGAHGPLVDSGDWRERIDLGRHRYMREDVVEGLAFLVSVGDWAGVPMPVARGLLTIAGAVLGEDPAGRTLARHGLADLDRAGMRRLLAEFPA
jgi:opine dehydrogenase